MNGDVKSFRRFGWDCADGQNCFNKKRRLNFEYFYSALPGKISFSDIDGIVEIAGHVLIMEWKSSPGPLPFGQRLMFERMTCGQAVTVFCIVGCMDEDNFRCSHMAEFHNGRCRDWTEIDGLTDVVARIKAWVNYALAHPRVATATPAISKQEERGS